MPINPPENLELSELNSILITKLDAIGDFVLTTPFLRGLRHSAPNASINLLVSPGVFPIAESCPYVNRVLSVSKNGTFQITGSTEAITNGIIADFSSKNFDLAVVPRWDYDYYEASSLCAMSGARNIVGFSMPERHRNSPPYTQHFTSALNRPFAAHEVEHNLALLEFLGGTPQDQHLELWLTEEEALTAKEIMAGIPGEGPIVIVCPGASMARRTLPPQKLKAILERVKQNVPEIRFLVLGQKCDSANASVLTSGIPNCFSLCGATNIRQTISLINFAAAAIVMDSGPAHIAAAANIPVVVFSAFPKNGNSITESSVLRWRPWSHAETLVLQPEKLLWPCEGMCCANDHHCILGILEEESAQAITGLIKRAITAQ